jgi:hypothetical protein
MFEEKCKYSTKYFHYLQSQVSGLLIIGSYQLKEWRVINAFVLSALCLQIHAYSRQTHNKNFPFSS